MEKDKLQMTLNKLKEHSYDAQINEIKQFSVETLEKLSVILYKEYFNMGYTKFKKFDLLNSILHERVNKINSNFEWTNENKSKLLKINEKIIQTFEKAYNEAISTAKKLEKRISKNDNYLKDYEIDIKISLYMSDEYYDKSNNIGRVLSEPISNFYPINDSFGHTHYHGYLDNLPIYLDKTKNWNTEYFDNIFENDYIGYAIHALLITRQWSFKDIISINKIWADVEVKHQ
jgi:hypothetical protein